MQAVVLVGGMGTRLRPLTHETPKQMLCVAGVTMLERVIARLGGFGIDRVVLSMGYKPDIFLAAFPDGHVAGVEIVYAVEPKPLDTAGGIKFAVDFAGISETFLVVNGDVLCDFDIGELITAHRRNRGQATIALFPVEDPSAFGVVPTSPDGKVLAFIEKPTRELAPTNCINAGIYVLEPQALDSIQVGDVASIEKVVFPNLVKGGHLYARQFDGFWIDAGTIANFYATNMDFLAIMVGAQEGLADPQQVELVGKVPPGFELLNGSLIAKTAKVSPEAQVVSSLIGHNVTLEPGVLVMNSIVMDSASISHDSVVLDSIVGIEVVIPPDSSLNDGCVIAAGANIASGLRLSGQKIPN